MEEQETPLEEVHEHIHEHAAHSREGWVMGVAVSTALIAAVAALASLLSGDNVNEAMMEQIRASDRWGQYQAKSIKAVELATRVALLESNGKAVPDDVRKKLTEYDSDQDKIKKMAEDLNQESESHMRRHHITAKAVTLAQIAIAISAIAVLTRQKWFWVFGLAFGAAGLVFLIWGVGL